MKLLISPTTEEEAAEAIAGGADIIDVKNPKEGALGANFPWVIKRIKAITPPNVEVSCTLGDASSHPGATALAALGAATTGVDYIKTGLQGVQTREEAVYIMRKIAQAIRDYDSHIKVVVVGYADARRASSINPMVIPEIALEAELDVAMIDTAIKDGKNTFAWLTMDQLSSFVDTSHRYGLTVALAGAIQKEDLPRIHLLNADVLGIRSAACTDNDRVNGRLKKEYVRELADIMKNLEDEDHKSGLVKRNTDTMNKNI